MNVRISKPQTWRITTTYTRADGTEGTESRLFNFPSEPTALRLRVIARGLVDPDMKGFEYKSHTAERVG